MTIQEKLVISAWAIGIPLLVAWVKIRIWDWRRDRSS